MEEPNTEEGTGEQASANKYPYVFVDESGDPGFKLEHGSSALFCLAAVIFQSRDAMDATEATMYRLKHSLSIRRDHEFHFNKESNERRLLFCQSVSGCDFQARAVVIDKTRIYEDSILRRSPNHFYNFFTKMLLQHSFDSIENAKVVIDGSMKRELKTYLRQELNKGDKRIIRETEFRDSKNSPLIQLADMVAGSVARAYRPDDKNTQEYVRALAPRIGNIWEFGKDAEGSGETKK